MAWDTEGTRRRLLEAATAEFSAFGLAGGRVDRIADAASVNKQRIYSYFGSKVGLFDAVVAAEMARIMQLTPIEGEGSAAVLDYAARMFDHHSSDPVLARLLFWEGLEGRPAGEVEARRALTAEKADQLVTALPHVERVDAAELLLTIITLCCAQPVLGSVRDLLGLGGTDAVARRRAEVLRIVGLAVDDLIERG